MMNLLELEQKYDRFYVPAMHILAAGQDLRGELLLNISDVEVDLKEKTAGRFSFQITDAFDWEQRAFVGHQDAGAIDLLELFAFGSPIEIFLGYGVTVKLALMLRGVVTELSTGFSEGETPILTVSGYDLLYPLTIGKNTHHWENFRDSDAVSDLVRPTGLRTDIRRTDPEKPRIDQSQQADLAFMNKLAERNGMTFYARDRQFYFGPRNNDQSEALTLDWGKGLLGFSPAGNLADQIETVEVHGWSAERGEAIVGRASRGDESGRDGTRQSGAERLASALNSRPAMRIRAAVHTQAEADARARAILEERAQQFVTGEGESIGLPEILPDTNIALQGLGASFSKTYYVKAATHRLDGSGYRTSFSVQETTV